MQDADTMIQVNGMVWRHAFIKTLKIKSDTPTIDLMDLANTPIWPLASCFCSYCTKVWAHTILGMLLCFLRMLLATS
jgi:hypothetical protein